MADQAAKDQNYVNSLIAVSNADGVSTVKLYADPVTHRLLVDLPTGSGDVVGPASATDEAIARFDGTTGKLIQNSAVTISNAGAITVAGEFTLPIVDGSASQVLQTDGNGVVSWQSVAGTGIVETVVGTANRIVVDSTDPANPIVNISTSYVGQATITTLGTITTGVWNGTVVAGQYGGTGVANTGKTITIGGNFEIAGAFTFTGTVTGNTSVTFPTSGTLATTTYVPTTITVANEATDTTCFIAFFTAASGDLGPKTNANMTFNSNTGVATFASTVLTTTDINGGTIDGTTIGASSPTTGVFTTLVAGSTTSLLLGTAGSAVGNIGFRNATSGTITLAPVTGALGTVTLSLPAATDTLVGRATTDTLTNKTLTSPAITTATFSGAQVLAEGASIQLDPALSADGTYSGITITGTAGATLAFGDLIYLAAADSRWELTDADSVTTCGAVLTGMCVLAAAGDGSATTILLQGNIRADAAFPALTVGANVYAGLTAGDIVTTAPSATDDVVHVVGKALTADSIYFNPSPDYITIV